MQLEIPNHTNGSFKSNSNEAYWRYFGSSHVQILTLVSFFTPAADSSSLTNGLISRDKAFHTA